MKRVELGPEDVALEPQRIQNGGLLVGPKRMAADIVQREFGIPGRLCEPLVEVAQRVFADEIIACEHARDTLGDDLRREQLCQR